MQDMVFPMQQESMMTNRKTARLVTLGAAKIETKGVSSIYSPDQEAQKKPSPGLTQD